MRYMMSKKQNFKVMQEGRVSVILKVHFVLKCLLERIVLPIKL